jgi:dihydroneopterin aldolase
MNDKIFINDIEVFARHGFQPWEKLKLQRFLVSVCAEFDGATVKISDNISHTIDYAKLLDIVIDAVENSSFNLIERLSGHIAYSALAEFPNIASLAVVVKKFPDSIAKKKFSAIGFSSTFSRDDFNWK